MKDELGRTGELAGCTESLEGHFMIDSKQFLGVFKEEPGKHERLSSHPQCGTAHRNEREREREREEGA
jgi:hypothetical protein